MATFQGTDGLAHGGDSFGVVCDGEDTETIPAETITVDVLCPGRFVGQQLSVKTALSQIPPYHRHGAPVSFEEKP